MRHRADVARIANAVESIAAVPTDRNTGQPGREKFPLLGRLTLAIGGRPASVQRGIRSRRSFPIVAYVGPNGGGKTLAMVLDTLPTLAGIRWECDNPAHLHTQRGETSGYRRVLSTVKLFDHTAEWSGDRWERPTHPLYTEFNDFDQLLEAEHCDVLSDEVIGVASSRESGRMDPRVQNVLVQLRRRDVVFRWSAPNWARADKIIREVTQCVVECRGYFPGRPLVSTSDADGLWAPKRVFRFSAFDAMEFEEWSAGKREKQETITRHWYKGTGSAAFGSYDTLDAVTVVSHASADDHCGHCGKTQRKEYCKCSASPTGRRGSSGVGIVLDTVH